MSDFRRDFVLVCRMIKIEHSVFALPFAYMGAFLAARGWPGFWNMFLLTVAMVAVRSFAMAVNRYADIEIDKANPRTQDRPLVTGDLSPRFTFRFILGAGALFVLACAFMNWLCFALAIPALAWSAFYSYTKRFTSWCHFVLGSVLGLAPVAGWLCVQPQLTLPAVILFLGVTFWVAGFDLLYATQDREFDREFGLHSMPAKFGLRASLAVANVSHLVAAAMFLLAGWAAGMGWPYFIVALVVAGVLMWEHSLVSADDMSRVNMVFFTLNGAIAVALFAAVLADIYL